VGGDVLTPLIVLTGFLGAGKTTFLERVLPALVAGGIAPRVILNDYRDARVDAARLATLSALVTPITGDCVCCGSQDELLAALTTMALMPGTAVLLEANGTTDAEDLLATLTTHHQLRHFARPMQVAVVDASRWQQRWWDNALEQDQVATASHLWLNWTERVGASRRTAVEAAVAQVAPRAARVIPEAFATDVISVSAALRDAPPRRVGLPAVPSGKADHLHAHRHEHQHHFASWDTALPTVVDRAVFCAWGESLPLWVTRAKGVVRFRDEPDEAYIWSTMGGHGKVYLNRLGVATIAPMAVFIGARLDVHTLADGLTVLE
jgi:G3E family GTPase